MVIFLFHLFLLFISRLEASQDGCKQKCGHGGPPIRFPFQIKENQQPNGCGYPGFELSCDGNKQTVLELPGSGKMIVEKIDYKSQTIDVSAQDGCFARHLHGLDLSGSPFRFNVSNGPEYVLFNCSPPQRDLTLVPCLNGPGYYVHALYSSADINVTPLTSCTKIYNISHPSRENFPTKIIRFGWAEPDCRGCESQNKICRLETRSMNPGAIVCNDKPKNGRGVSEKLELAGYISGCFFLVLAIIVFYRFYRSYKVEKENQVKIESFLEDYRAMRPARYSYADIKRITNQFRDKLGQGSYGSVYKGMLSNEISVAVKVLNNSRDNGDDFINEVGTIGKIHHVNVVRLVGFCADGCTRALVYEYLSNDSLDKFIFFENSNHQSLGWKRLHEIALGIAKGVDYLHQGCDYRILHFDIKPHNILLDQNFNPKISDFGLAKLCSKEQSAVSITAARGTLGYIAPEVISRNFGKVSYKLDVYSYGMLLLEMVGGRKNMDVILEGTNHMHFPEWIYHRMEHGDELQLRIEEDRDTEIVKKLATVGLWCIQWNPVDRPSMKVVIQMLEGDVNNLMIPPNPFSMTNVKRPSRYLEQELTVISESE